MREISTFILSLGERQAASVSGTAGYYEDEDYSVLGGSHYGQVIVALPEKKWVDFPDNPDNDPVKHIDYIRAKLQTHLEQTFPNADGRPQVKVFPEASGPVAGKAVNIRISGESLDRELEVSTRIMVFLKSEKETQALTELTDDRAARINVVKYVPDQEKAYELGLSPGRITEMISGALHGVTVGKFRTSTEEVDLKIRMARVQDRGSFSDGGLAEPEDILNIPMVEHSSSPIFLRDVVTIDYSSEQDSRGRNNGKSTVNITANIASGASLLPQDRVTFLVSRYFKTLSKEYPDISLVFAGESETSGKTFDTLFVGLVMALLMIYLILAVQFSDYIQPIIVLSAVAFAVIGVTFGMFITRSTFTVGSPHGRGGPCRNDGQRLPDPHRFYEQTYLRRPDHARSRLGGVSNPHAPGAHHHHHHHHGPSAHGHRYSLQVRRVVPHGHGLCHRAHERHPPHPPHRPRGIRVSPQAEVPNQGKVGLISRRM